ncbi:hypothetical protein N7501_009165 [Penicillium viridicatum]|nr:hypothetical protein N7501_009165 [Penicillium viridicatum]
MAIKDGIDIWLLQSRLTYPVRDIAHSCAFLHDIGHALEDSGPSGLAEGKKNCKTQRRNVKCKTSSPMFIPYSVPTLYIPKPTVIDWIGGSRESNPLRLRPHSSLLIGQH